MPNEIIGFGVQFCFSLVILSELKIKYIVRFGKVCENFKTPMEMVKMIIIFNVYIINLLGFIGSSNFCAKFNFRKFVQKSYKFRVMVNMNDICTYLIF